MFAAWHRLAPEQQVPLSCLHNSYLNFQKELWFFLCVNVLGMQRIMVILPLKTVKAGGGWDTHTTQMTVFPLT